MEGGGGDHQVMMRRVHIVYFLSRNGIIEQPHLIRVHQIYQNGVRLRDVKRWLSELRGKEMPNSFAWSYKRRYKKGYVWQDLTDDDLITPVSDNEYVLKGSQSETVSSSSSCGEKTESSPASKPDPPPVTGTPPSVTEKPQVDVENFLDHLHDESPKPPPRLDGESPGTSPSSSSSTFNISDTPEPEQRRPGDIICVSAEEKKKIPAATKEEQQSKKCDDGSSSSPPPHYPFGFGRSKSYSSGRASHVLRNLLTCRAVETNDAALLPVSHRRLEEKRRLSVDFCGVRRGDGDALGGSQREKLPSSGSRRSFGAKSWRKAGEDITTAAAAYRPIAEPNCSRVDGIGFSRPNPRTREKGKGIPSLNHHAKEMKPGSVDTRQCGKAFKPEKLHSHMKSCRALLKGRGKSLSSVEEKLPERRSASQREQRGQHTRKASLWTN